MITFLFDNYYLIKSFHVIMCISWMAGLFYLPRLFVYHTQTRPGSEEYNRFVIMETKLLNIIMFPAALLSFVFGFINAYILDCWFFSWFLVKLLLVFVMLFVHIFDCFFASKFKQKNNIHSENFFRVWNEFPTLLMIGIVILVIVKPFS
jgi:protoporphyrinogen IX oxidase